LYNGAPLPTSSASVQEPVSNSEANRTARGVASELRCWTKSIEPLVRQNPLATAIAVAARAADARESR
jgi:hypothetical protein